MAHGCQKQSFGFARFVSRTPLLLHQVGVIHMPGDVVETTEHHVLALVTGKDKTGLQIAPRDFQLDLSQFVLTIIALQQGNQFRGTLPLMRPLVFQQDLSRAALDHAQPHGCAVEHGPIEFFALGQGLAGTLGRFDDLLAVPAVEAPADQPKQYQQARRAGQRPFGIAKEVLITDRVQPDPGRGPARTQLEAQTIAGNAQAQGQILDIPGVPQQYIAGRRDQGQTAVGGVHQQALQITDIADVQ